MEWEELLAALNRELNTLKTFTSLKSAESNDFIDLHLKLGGVAREPVVVETVETDFIAIEECLYRIKSEILVDFEKCLEKLIQNQNKRSKKKKVEFLEDQLVLQEFLDEFELIESICKSLTVESSGDFLNTYLLMLKVRPFKK